MHAALILSILGLVISLLATAISTYLVIRQVTFQRQANQIPVPVSLAQEYRSVDFQISQKCVDSELRKYDPNLGVSGLPGELRMHVIKVTSFYGSLGVLVFHGIAEQRLVLSLLGYRALNTWSIVEPYVIREREKRNSEYLSFYEDLVCRFIDDWPQTRNSELGLRRRDDKQILPAFMQASQAARSVSQGRAQDK